MMRALKKALVIITTLLIALLYLCPFYIIIAYSFKSMSDSRSKWAFPTYLFLDNYADVFKRAALLNALKNDTIITVTAVVILIIVSSAAAYPLARLRTKLNRRIYVAIIALMILPPLGILVPLYRTVVDIKGVNTYWGVILLHVTFNLPVAIFLFTGFMNTISVQLDEAAIIDGCGRISVFFRIIFPLLKNVSLTVAILAGVGIWNDYQFSMFFLESRMMFTPTKAMSQFTNSYGTAMGAIAAGCVISMLPVAIMYFLMQKQFMSGSVAGAIKG